MLTQGDHDRDHGAMEHPVQIVGILNTTPDSYYDGGKFLGVERAVRRAGEMLREGADIIEVGGESTGPGSQEVSEGEELQRTIPVIRAIKERFPQANVAIDTYKAHVALEALHAGVMMVNDVTAGRGDPRMFQVLASARPCVMVRCPEGASNPLCGQGPFLVLMYTKDETPRTTVQAEHYEDVVSRIKKFLKQRKDAAVATGVPSERIILDPGMGHFISSDPRYSFEVLARLGELRELGSPLFLSPSRKSCLAGSENLKAMDRLPGTIAASAIAMLLGATYIRTHDVEAVRRACEIAGEVRKWMVEQSTMET